jgi:hypothetical protein
MRTDKKLWRNRKAKKELARQLQSAPENVAHRKRTELPMSSERLWKDDENTSRRSTGILAC